MKIFCHAKKLSDIGAEIESQTRPVIQALIQLYMYPNADEHNHWQKEVWANLHEIAFRKGSNKLPKKEFILRNTVEPNIEYLKSYVESVRDKECNLISIEIDYEDLSGLIYNYFEWLADKLSKSWYVSAKEVHTKLDSIGL